MLCTQRMHRSDGGMTKRNGVVLNCFLVGLFCGIAWGGFRVKHSFIIHRISVEALDDMSATYIYDVREAHNVAVDGIKGDVLILE
jgi:hypothetical protein